MELACTVVCLLVQQLQLPESTCVGRDLGTFSRTGQWALIIQPSGPQIIPDVTCAVKAATQIRVMNSAHFILSFRVLNSLCSFIYNKQTHVYVYTHILLPLYAVPTSSSTHTPKSFTELAPMELHRSASTCFTSGRLLFPLLSHPGPSGLLDLLQWHLECSRKMISLFIMSAMTVGGGGETGSSRMGSNYTSCTLYPLNFILMIGVEWEAKSLNKEIYNKLGQVWWGKCSCGTNISINQFKSTGEFLRDSFAGHKCWPYVVCMYRNLLWKQCYKVQSRVKKFIYIEGELTPEVIFYLNVWGTGIRDSLGLATIWTLNWSTQPGWTNLSKPLTTPYKYSVAYTETSWDHFWKIAWKPPVLCSL